MKDKQLLESIQRRFTRLFPDLRNLSYNKRLDHLVLGRKADRADLIDTFKLFKGLTGIPYTTFFEVAADSSTRGLLQEVTH